jgi:hypothetical protein
MSFDVVLGLILLAVVATIVFSVARGRPRQPPHTPGSLVRGYHRSARAQRRHIDYRIRSGRRRRR